MIVVCVSVVMYGIAAYIINVWSYPESYQCKKTPKRMPNVFFVGWKNFTKGDHTVLVQLHKDQWT